MMGFGEICLGYDAGTPPPPQVPVPWGLVPSKDNPGADNPNFRCLDELTLGYQLRKGGGGSALGLIAPQSIPLVVETVSEATDQGAYGPVSPGNGEGSKW